jgi:hypothetical protein
MKRKRAEFTVELSIANDMLIITDKTKKALFTVSISDVISKLLEIEFENPYDED